MTTATVQRPPTEAEIRAIVEARLSAPEGRPGMAPGDMNHDIFCYVHDAAQWLLHPAWYALYADKDDGDPELTKNDLDGALPMWIDLRTSEAKRLEQLVDEARKRAAEKCLAIIVDELTAAGVAFAAEHPNAPRPSEDLLAAA